METLKGNLELNHHEGELHKAWASTNYSVQPLKPD
jgi:hypothetical protein